MSKSRSCLSRWPERGGTRVGNVEVFAGATVSMLRPLVACRWYRQFQAAVDDLIIRNAGGTC